MTVADRVLQQNLSTLTRICERRGVKRLDLFGSASRADFDPSTSDYDFLVEFKTLSPGEHASAFFGLQEDLEKLFERPVDLVEVKPIRNPYFRQEVEATRVPLY